MVGDSFAAGAVLVLPPLHAISEKSEAIITNSNGWLLNLISIV
jgi:hypothetical protein